MIKNLVLFILIFCFACSSNNEKSIIEEFYGLRIKSVHSFSPIDIYWNCNVEDTCISYINQDSSILIMFREYSKINRDYFDSIKYTYPPNEWLIHCLPNRFIGGYTYFKDFNITDNYASFESVTQSIKLPDNPNMTINMMGRTVMIYTYSYSLKAYIWMQLGNSKFNQSLESSIDTSAQIGDFYENLYTIKDIQIEPL